jgi:hypothetical protein
VPGTPVENEVPEGEWGKLYRVGATDVTCDIRFIEAFPWDGDDPQKRRDAMWKLPQDAEVARGASASFHVSNDDAKLAAAEMPAFGFRNVPLGKRGTYNHENNNMQRERHEEAKQDKRDQAVKAKKASSEKERSCIRPGNNKDKGGLQAMKKKSNAKQRADTSAQSSPRKRKKDASREAPAVGGSRKLAAAQKNSSKKPKLSRVEEDKNSDSAEADNTSASARPARAQRSQAVVDYRERDDNDDSSAEIEDGSAAVGAAVGADSGKMDKKGNGDDTRTDSSDEGDEHDEDDDGDDEDDVGGDDNVVPVLNVMEGLNGGDDVHTGLDFAEGLLGVFQVDFTEPGTPQEKRYGILVAKITDVALGDVNVYTTEYDCTRSPWLARATDAHFYRAQPARVNQPNLKQKCLVLFKKLTQGGMLPKAVADIVRDVAHFYDVVEEEQ